LAGGSGGYIYVATKNVYDENTYSPNAIIEAKGGYGRGNSFSGAGGVVVFDEGFDIPHDQVDISGGISESADESGCQNGAAGTLWYRPSDHLVVKNNVTVSDRYTVVKPPSGGLHLAKELTILD